MSAALALVSFVAGAGYAVAEAPPEGVWLHASVDAGAVGGDVVAGVGVGVGVETEPFAAHLSLPLTLRLIDLAPPVDPAGPAACKLVRCEEWLEAGAPSADALGKIVEEVRLFHPGDAFHLKAGGLFATLGHGALVDEYTNASDWDHRRSGLYLQGDLPWGATEIQALAGDFLAPQRVFGARVSTSPLFHRPAAGARDDGDVFDRLLGRLRLGFEVAGDAVAPTGPGATGAAGDVVPGSKSRPVGGAAVDATWALLDDGALQVTPFASASSTTGLGGAALGAGAQAGLDVSLDVAFAAARAGVRGFFDGPGHRTGIFDTLYDVDRRRYALAAGGFSDSGVADLAAPGGAGGAVEAELVVMRVVRAGARAHVDAVPEATRVEGFLEVDAGSVRVDVRALQRAVARPVDLLAFGDRTLVVADAAWQVAPPLSVYARWLHGPRFHGGVPVADDDVVVGCSFDLVLAPQ